MEVYDPAQVLDQLAPISAVLYGDVAAALEEADRTVGPLIKPTGAVYIRSHVMRLSLRIRLSERSLPGWGLGGNPALSGQLHLVQADSGLLLKVLKERRRTYPGGVPPPGYNRTRREYWRNEPLQPVLPGMPRLLPTDGWTNLLLLWDLVDAMDIDQGFTLRVVHTLTPGSYGSNVPIDLSVPLDASGGLWESLQFPGSDDSEDFFVDVDEPGQAEELVV
ncbi:MAG: hypothetical protein LBI33_11115 [Propionibacteriaceae bacterium]|jgi:hypothetical protein|nr:hypothetical protein [Propionibacteriaceae bacterium]